MHVNIESGGGNTISLSGAFLKGTSFDISGKITLSLLVQKLDYSIVRLRLLVMVTAWR